MNCFCQLLICGRRVYLSFESWRIQFQELFEIESSSWLGVQDSGFGSDFHFALVAEVVGGNGAGCCCAGGTGGGGGSCGGAGGC